MKKILLLVMFVVSLPAIEFAKNQPGDHDRGFTDGYNVLSIDMFQDEFDKIARAQSKSDRYIARAGSLTGAIKGSCGKFTYRNVKGKSTDYLSGFEKGCFSKGNEIYQASFNIKSLDKTAKTQVKPISKPLQTQPVKEKVSSDYSLMHSGQSNVINAKLMMVLQDWNDANNVKDVDTLSRLYASKITYYGSKLSRKKCIKDKKRLFRKYPHFSQSAQNIAYTALRPQLYKIIFDKHVRIKPNSKNKVYPSYLLVDISSTPPSIVEEGDSVTDKNIKRKNVIPTYTIGDTHELKGKIETVLHYGPPGYGEDPQNDQRLTAYIFKLDHPINAVALNGDEVSFSTQTTEVQLLAFDYLSQLKRAASRGKTLTLRGEFFSAHTGYHIRDVLMDVKSIK